MKAQIFAALAALTFVAGAAPEANARDPLEGCHATVVVKNTRGKMIYVRELEVKKDGKAWVGLSSEGPKFIKKGRSKTWRRHLTKYPYAIAKTRKVKWRAIWSVADGKNDARSRTFWSTSEGFLECELTKGDRDGTKHEIIIAEKKTYRK